MWKTDCETPTANVRRRGDCLMKCEYKVERISGFLETYLNKKASQGWRCISVLPATEPYLEWTQIAIFERIVDDPDGDINSEITVREEDIAEDTDNISTNENTALETIANIQNEFLDCNKGSHEKSFSKRIAYYAICSILLILYIIILRFLKLHINLFE